MPLCRRKQLASFVPLCSGLRSDKRTQRSKDRAARLQSYDKASILMNFSVRTSGSSKCPQRPPLVVGSVSCAWPYEPLVARFTTGFQF